MLNQSFGKVRPKHWYMSVLMRCAFAGAMQIAVPALAQSPSGPSIVDAAYVQEALKRNVQVWDVRDARDYARGHLPGAITIGDAAKALRDDNAEDFIALPRIEKLFSDAGLDPKRETVVYGWRGTWNAYFGQYTLRYFGGTRVAVYHEGMEGWQQAGLPVSGDAFKPVAASIKLTPAPGVAISTREMIERVARGESAGESAGAGSSRKLQIIDARTVKEFSGEDIRALRGGHIPGAVNIPYEANWVDPDTAVKLTRKLVNTTAGMSLKPVDDLRKLYAHFDPEKETVVYCQSGARASETAGVLLQLGFKNVKVYDSSWIGYGNTLDAPANNVTFFNVGALNARLGGMQTKIDTLEKALVEERAKR